MVTLRSTGFLLFLMFLFASVTTSGQTSTGERIPGPDSGACFLYVSYCGSRYNRSIGRSEQVIDAVKLPVSLLKKMPRLRSNGHSARNYRIQVKQQKLIRQSGGEKVVVLVNKKKFTAFYPKGLRRGVVIEPSEFIQWNFQEKFVPVPPPVIKQGRYNFYWYWYETDPVNIKYGLMIRT